uniref:Col_cuticle_N domain-containing protein n=1 Tax=Globodera pallida TaxID=36090 RepID=A0A183BHT6_GLOPA
MIESDSRIRAYKFVAYSAVTFSIVAVLSVVITLPMVYNYVAHVRRQMQHELGFCKGSAKDIYVEVNHMKSTPDMDMRSNRTARQTGGGYGPVVNPAPADRPAPRDHPDHLATPARPARPDDQEQMRLPGLQDLEDRQDLRENLDLKDHPENLACQHKMNRLYRENPESRATQDLPDLQGRLEPRGPTDHLGPQARRENQDRMDCQAKTGKLGL